jgi:potassium-transporting ATPase ATP-binding subunit
VSRRTSSLFDPAILRPAAFDSLRKLHPRTMLRNPVLFVVYVGSILTSGLWLHALSGAGDAEPGFILAVCLGLWFTVLFANFAEAMAEGRGKAQAASLRRTRSTTTARMNPGSASPAPESACSHSPEVRIDPT